jgi:ribosomal protein S18 acetylase RimI-like enzyme
MAYIREAGPDDLPAIKHLLDHNNLLRWPALPWPDHLWRERLKQIEHGVFVAVDDEVVVGVTSVETGPAGAEAWRLAAAGAGVEETLIGAAEEYARQQGARHLTYRLVSQNSRLHRTFEARGYAEVEGWPEYERFRIRAVEPPDLSIRTLGAADLEQVAAIDRAAFGEVAYDRSTLEMMLNTPAYRLIGIEKEGRLVSFGVSCLLADGIGYFIKTATLPAERGGGLAGALCAAVINDFTARGATRIWAHTWDANYRGMHLLEKYEFRRTGRSLVMRVTL